MNIYNTLTRKKESFEPNNASEVKLYCCGPTVYNYAHIGNLRTYVFQDFLRRTLEFNGYKVKHVMNITDVGHLTSDSDEGEDKMKKGAEREKKTVWQIAEHYTEAFLEDMDRLNLVKPTDTPKATDHIQEMIDQIKQLEENGLAYIGENGNVYFDTSKFKNYGELAQLDKQELQAGARIEVDANKKNPHDFVLWFVSSKHGEQDMKWDSPWGTGFPGWHMECSAMASKYLGSQFDIHCGGIDHIPVHHTNEIAQAEGAMGVNPWVKVWMHGNFLVLKNKEKMAKSGDNFLTLKTLMDKWFDPLDYRYLCLQTHYKKELMFDWESLEGSKIALERLRDKVVSLKREVINRNEKGDINETYLGKFKDSINNDLNMPEALALTQRLIGDTGISDADKLLTIQKFDSVLGLKLDEPRNIFKKREIPPEILQLIEQRNEARKNKDFAKSDELRDKIQASGQWEVKDGKGGTEVVPA